MASTLQAYRNIASMLSFKSNEEELKNAIKKNEINWDDIVKISSEQLVLPTIFCRLNQKKLDHLLPQDLYDYLNEITSINRNRNDTLLNEAIEISNLLEKHQINHVFLKGLALLASDLYGDYGERMITDIDLLIEEEDINFATNLITEKGYKPNTKTIGDIYLSKRHTPRLVNKNKLGAVEIHTKLFDKSYSSLLHYKDFFNNNSNSKIPIPSTSNLLKHNILNYQINDKGSYYNEFAFKNAYDTLVINNHLKNPNEIKLLKNTVYKKNLVLLTAFFPEVITQKFGLRYKFNKKMMILKLKQPQLKKLWYTVLYYINYISLLFNRLLLFIKNNNYRKEIIKTTLKKNRN